MAQPTAPAVTSTHFEIYETGDPFSTAWDASEAFSDGGSVYRGDISGIYSKQDLINALRRQYPRCKIVNRDSGRRIRQAA